MAERLSDSQDRENKWGGVFSSLPDFELAPNKTAFVMVDMQYLDAHRDGCDRAIPKSYAACCPC